MRWFASFAPKARAPSWRLIRNLSTKLPEADAGTGEIVRRRFKFEGSRKRPDPSTRESTASVPDSLPSGVPVTRFTTLRCTAELAEFKTLYTSTIEPAYRDCDGFLGAQLLIDRTASGAPRCAAISTWRDKAALAASQDNEAYRQAMVELVRLIEPSSVLTELWENATLASDAPQTKPTDAR